MGPRPVNARLFLLLALLAAPLSAAAQTVSGACTPPSGHPGLSAVSKLLDAVVGEERPSAAKPAEKQPAATAPLWKVRSLNQQGATCAINAIGMVMNYWKETKGTHALPTYGERSLMKAAVVLGLSEENPEGHTYSQFRALADAFKNHYEVTTLKEWGGDFSQLEALVKRGPVVVSFAMANVEDVPDVNGHDYHAVVLLGVTPTHVHVVDGMFFPDGARFPRDQFEGGWRAAGSKGILFEPKPKR